MGTQPQISQDVLLLDLKKKKKHIQEGKTHEGKNEQGMPRQQECRVMLFIIEWQIGVNRKNKQ